MTSIEYIRDGLCLHRAGKSLFVHRPALRQRHSRTHTAGHERLGQIRLNTDREGCIVGPHLLLHNMKSLLW